MVLFLMMATYDSEGAMVQMGKPKSAGIAVSSLLYNEYIVYSLDQVRIKYLVQLVCTCFLFPPLLPAAAAVSLCGFVATGLPLQADRVLTCVFLSSFFSSLFSPHDDGLTAFFSLLFHSPFTPHRQQPRRQKAKKKKTDRR